ncbi:MAG: hypothetical protein KGL39_33035, partial [Patescibacteria group bacterium]|nr:hypothetical protein [Patescibacteria group bacterium]
MAPTMAASTRGYDAWRTRRRGQYLNAINSLDRLDYDHLLLAFGTITDFLAPAVPVGTLCAPYEAVLNGVGEMSFRVDGMLLNPGIPDALPSREAVKQFAADLRGEWLDRLAKQVGLSGREKFVEV